MSVDNLTEVQRLSFSILAMALASNRRTARDVLMHIRKRSPSFATRFQTS